MKSFKTAFWIAACGLTFCASAQAATQVAGPTATFANPNSNDTFCQVVNATTHPVTVTIRARNDAGLTEAQKIVTLQPDQGSSLNGGDNVATCTFDGPGKRSVVGMLINVDPSTGYYSTVIVAQ